jgi:hypothetical protein
LRVITLSGVPAGVSTPVPQEEGSFRVAVVVRGPGAIDVRDSGNAWLRVTLSDDRCVVVAAGVFLRGVRQSALGSCAACVWSDSSDVSSDAPAWTTRPSNFVPMETSVRDLVSELCALFYALEWVTGTGGSISIRSVD